jgi:hypothetical protein
MDRDQSWQIIAEQRLSLADLLDNLSDADWETPSLCAGWRVRDVAAHVAMAPQVPNLAAMIADGTRARGSFHRLNHDVAVRHADSRPGEQIVAELRRHAYSRRLPVVTSYRNILFDILVHGIRCRPKPPLRAPPASGPWAGRSGPGTGYVDWNWSPRTPAGPPGTAPRSAAPSTPCCCCSPAAPQQRCPN